jgi:uroporphyrin-III C-methyltransferase/precorrin-2 dehydrogenase/sirohydrochlorin ferrochelatase
VTTRRRAVRRRVAPTPRGFVSLVGAGPGDPELLTARALDRLAHADLVLYDGLVPAAIVARAGSSAERVSVARRAGTKTLTQADVSDRMIAGARRGLRVVRLKAGDPFVFGRGGEEVHALAAARVPFEIVPGLSAALVAPALAGISLTHRGVASGFVVVSGHAPEAYAAVLQALPPGATTVVVLMGLGQRAAIATCLVDAGWSRRTPAVVVVNASRPRQRIWTGTLATLGRADSAGADGEPGVIVIGDVVRSALRPAAVTKIRKTD